MWALDFLGLDTSADVKTIKRAYAKLLKVTRPDEDPDAFQQLNEAYQAALNWYKQSQQKTEHHQNSIDISSIDTSTAQDSSDIVSTVQDIPDDQDNHHENKEAKTLNFLDMNHFCEQCIGIAQQYKPEKLKLWLSTQQELWSLNNKQILGESLIDSLHKYPVGIHKECFLVISNFFDLNMVQNNIDYQTICDLGDHLNALWLIDSKNIDLLKQHHKRPPRFGAYKPEIENNWPLLEQLHKPFSWLQAGLASIPTKRANHWGHSLHLLLQNLDYTVPNSIDPKQIKFWLSFIKDGLQASKLLCWTVFNLVIFLITFLMTLYPIYLFKTNNVNNTGIFENIILSLCVLPVMGFFISSIALIILIFLWYCLWIKTPYYTLNNCYLRSLSIFWTPSLCLISIPLFLCGNIYFLLLTLLALFNEVYKIAIKIQQRFKIPKSFFIITYFFFGMISAIYKETKNTTSAPSADNVNIFSAIAHELPKSLIYSVGLLAILLIWLSNFLIQRKNHYQDIP